MEVGSVHLLLAESKADKQEIIQYNITQGFAIWKDQMASQHTAVHNYHEKKRCDYEYTTYRSHGNTSGNACSTPLHVQ